MMPRTKQVTHPRKKSTPPTNPIPPRRQADVSPAIQAVNARGFFPSRYVSDDALDTLLIREDFELYVKNLHWEKFVTLKPLQFQELTAEFIASLKVERDNNTRLCSRLAFTLVGKHYRITIAQLNEIFGFATDGCRVMPRNFEQQFAWQEVGSGETYVAKSTKSTRLKNPALRYLHRFMSCNFFARKESPGVVELNELFLLFCAKTATPVSTGYWLADMLDNVAHKRKGMICVGGLITTLAIALDRTFDPRNCGFTRIFGSDKLDLLTLEKMKMVTKTAGTYVMTSNEPPSQEDRQKRPRVDDESDSASSSSDEDAPVPPNYDVIAKLEALEDKVDRNHAQVLHQLELVNQNLARLLSLHPSAASSSQPPPP